MNAANSRAQSAIARVIPAQSESLARRADALAARFTDTESYFGLRCKFGRGAMMTYDQSLERGGKSMAGIGNAFKGGQFTAEIIL